MVIAMSFEESVTSRSNAMGGWNLWHGEPNTLQHVYGCKHPNTYEEVVDASVDARYPLVWTRFPRDAYERLQAPYSAMTGF